MLVRYFVLIQLVKCIKVLLFTVLHSSGLHGCFFMYVIQAYTSQFVALIMFALMMSEDRLSLQTRRLEIINGLKVLPGQCCEQ